MNLLNCSSSHLAAGLAPRGRVIAIELSRGASPAAKWVTCAIVVAMLLVALPLHAKVKLGIDVLRDENFKILEGKRVGLVANPASVDGNMTSTIDILKSAKNVKLVALYGPEHGLYADAYAGDKVDDMKDESGLPIYSIYGKTRKPTTQMIDPIDVMVFDLQEIGSRSYTVISSMKLAMEACKEHDREFVVLDRPNPLGGERVEGPGLKKEFSSFVGLIDVPYVYGMTMGELAQYVRDRDYPDYKKLTVVKMQGWTRDMLWQDTGLLWVPTSPNVPHAETCAYYAATGFLGEMQSLSNGIGFTAPFEFVGAPWIDGDKLAAGLDKNAPEGIRYRAARFKPMYAAFKTEKCQGVQVYVDPRKAPSLVEVNMRILVALDAKKMIEQTAKDRIAMFNKVNGSDETIQWLSEGKPLDELLAKWKKECDEFRETRKKYLLY
jgi:uncharacterized protein YbbC (DUF1343 family)